MEIVIGSRNLHKIREIRQILASFPSLNLDLTSLIHFPNFKLEEGEKKTFKEKAINKALQAAKALNKWVIADESGLIVPSLKGEPRISGQSYAGEEASDAENRKKLLFEMQSMTDLNRSAYFECYLALASPKELIKCVTGSCEGSIPTEERGSGGFGYDPLFIKNEYDKTFGEIDEATKNRVSHRRKALEKLLPTLEKLCITSSTAIT